MVATRLSTRIARRFREQAIDVPSIDFIAGAGSFLELVAFEQLDVAPIGAQKAGSLKLGCGLRHGGSSHPEHIGQKFMCEWNSVGVDLVACLQEPTTQTGGNVVQSVTPLFVVFGRAEARSTDD